MPSDYDETSRLTAARHWIQGNQLESVGAPCRVFSASSRSLTASAGSLWACGLLASLAYTARRPIPYQLKIIHSRIYAQALTVSALVVCAGVEAYSRVGAVPKEEDALDYHPHRPKSLKDT